MNVDITEILSQWPFEPGKINVRLIEGDDGEQKIQVRLDLGILQMELDGRPDGVRPHGFDSLLEYYESQLDQTMRGGEPPFDSEPPLEPNDLPTGEGSQADRSEEDPAVAGAAENQGEVAEPHMSDNDSEFAEDENEPGQNGTPFVLTPEDCRALREEAVQYYHRYVSLLVLEDFDRVIRDTTRNLRLLDLCNEYAQAEEDRMLLEQFRPYITMMRARALASQALRDNETKAALHAIDEGIEALRHYYSNQDASDEFDSSNEVQALRGMRDSLIPKLPVSLKSELRQRLQRAIEDENYELASILRDELKMLPD
ncbi:hypothetical protein MNBD_PLANCTO03-360 [hydrothermal vent metagenome]|uniref:UVR domain-containing protein n=1 Tax=hydrothermal vent metagenome TaxID=652676 RepID=A0A3B1DUX8_9ZZZZ